MAASDTWDPTQWPAGTTPNTATTGPSKGQEAVALLSGVAPSLIYRLMNGGNSGNIPPQLLQLLQQSVDRQNYQNPLFEATTRQAFEGLPAYAREGLSLGQFTQSPVDFSSLGGGGGIGGGAGALGLATQMSPILYQALKHLFGGHTGVTTGPQQPPTGSGGGGFGFGLGANQGIGPGTNDYNFLMNNNLGGPFGVGPSGGIGDQQWSNQGPGRHTQAY